jgi:hypothetical protein
MKASSRLDEVEEFWAFASSMFVCSDLQASVLKEMECGGK